MHDEQQSLQRRANKPDFEITNEQATYFSSWHWAALHFLSAIPEIGTAKALAERTGLPLDLVLQSLTTLEKWGLVRNAKGRWQYAGGQFHLPRTSPYVSLHHQNWRHRAVLDAQMIRKQSLHYTTILTLSQEDVVRLHQALLSFISESERIARPSAPEEALVLSCDLFRV